MSAGEKFCSGCRRHKPDDQIYAKKTVTLRRGKSITYICVTCAEKIKARTERSAAA